MDRQGQWSLSPAYDLCHAEGSEFTSNHQLSLNGKTSDFTMADLKHLADYAGLPRGREKLIVEQVVEAFSSWSKLAEEIGVPRLIVAHVTRTLRMNW
ncbi:MAG: serine/threonine-protein kinase HipA [Planctomycetota bacterium]|jgi:serine/threonine-protein kinase HipA